MKLYLSGPMRGLAGLNFPAFHEAAALLRAAGHEVFNPAEQDEETGLDGTELAGLRILLGADLAWITSRAEGLVVLPGWEKSLGATAETATAWALGLPVWEIGPFLIHDASAPMATRPGGAA